MPQKHVKSYFEAACAIDVLNHLRQDGLGMEDANKVALLDVRDPWHY